MEQKKDIVIGIDLGTTFSCVAVSKNGQAKVIPSGKGYLTVPSVVGLSKRKEIVVGHVALDQIVLNPAETVYGSKRLIGRKYNSFIVQRMLQTMSYKIVEGPGSEAAVMLNGNVFSLTDIAALILTEVKDMAQGHLGQEIKRAVITVPAYYNDNQRHAVVEAGKRAGFKVERIVNEPTAAAVAYGFNKKLNQKILVYDLGGGTFDVSILQLKNNRFKVLGTGGDNFLGGVDFDTKVTEFIIDKFKDVTGKDIRSEKIAYQRLRVAVENAKRTLSVEKVAQINLPYLTEVNKKPTDLKMALRREELEQLTKGYLERTIQLCSEALTAIHMTVKDIDEVILVGGQTRMPMVVKMIEKYFGKSPRKGVHPDEVVALGAAILGNTIEEQGDVLLEDVLSIPIGISLPNGQFKILLDRNTPLPSTKIYKLTGHKEKKIEIDIYQGEGDKIFENEYLGSFIFPPPQNKKKGTQKLEMKFELSAQCLLSVKATDIETGQQTSGQMEAMQVPLSMAEGVAAEMKTARAKSNWFLKFAQRILGKSPS